MASYLTFLKPVICNITLLFIAHKAIAACGCLDNMAVFGTYETAKLDSIKGYEVQSTYRIQELRRQP